MALSTIVKHLYDGTITLSDGTGSPVTLAIPFTSGDLTISGLQETQRAVVKYEARGVLTTVRHAARTFPSGSFSFQVPEYMNAAVGNALDFALQQNGHSGNISTLTPTEVYGIDIILTTEGTDLGDAKDHTITLTDCVCTVDIAEGEPNAGTINFECLGTVTPS